MKKTLIALVAALCLVSCECMAEPPDTPPIPGSPTSQHELSFEELIGGLTRKKSLPIVQGTKSPPTILLEQKIDDDAAEGMQAALDQLAKSRPKEIRIIINSDGGELDGGFAISQMIERYPAKVTCIIDVRAQSMASAILQSCDVRVMTSRGMLMMHQAHLTCEDCEEHRLLTAAQDIRTITHQLAVQSCQKAKVKPAEWLEKTANGHQWMLTPDEALKLGFIDSVIPKVIW